MDAIETLLTETGIAEQVGTGWFVLVAVVTVALLSGLVARVQEAWLARPHLPWHRR